MVIRNVTVNDCTPQTIVIGRRGTYDTMQIAFDLTYLVENYGSGTAVLAVKRSQDESAYPAVVTQDGSTLTWTITETDTYYVGSGECQLMWYVDGGLAKTIIYPMVVMRDILSTPEEAPDGYENWIEHLTELGAETQQNAQAAAQSATEAESAKDDAVAAKEAAEAAQEAAETAVTHYPKIENNYWMVWDVASQSYVSTGIQAEGEDGYSPEISITTITGGHRVTITDKDHPQGQSFDVMDGQGGGGGTSDYTDLTNKPQINGHTLTGNQTAEQLGLATPSDIPTDAGEVTYDPTETYQSGTAGAALNDLSRHLSDLEDSISDAYDATASYAVGDFCINENTLYRCNTAIPTGGEAWTPAHWDAVQIVDLLGTGGGDVTDVQIDGTSIVSAGVANVPVGGNTIGVVQVSTDGNFGLNINPQTGVIRTQSASASELKAARISYKPVVPNTTHVATFYGLAKAAGDTTQAASANPVGTYTDEAKTAIKSMLGVDNDYELIRFIELESDSREIYINTDDKNEPFELGSFVIAIESVGASDSTREGYLKVAVNNTTHYPKRIADVSTAIRKAGSQCGVVMINNYMENVGRFSINLKTDNVSFVGNNGEITATLMGVTTVIQPCFSEQQIVSSFWIGTDNTTDKLGVGSRIAIYGIRK